MPLPATEQFANNSVTTLSAAISSTGATSISVTSAAGFPAVAQYRIKIDDEILQVTGGAGTTTWTVTRGAEGTTAATHSSGAVVEHDLTAGALRRWQPNHVPTPRMQKLLAWTMDGAAVVNTLIMSTGQIWLHKIAIPEDITVTNILIALSTNGATLTSGQNLAGIYDSGGNKLRETGDQTSVWNTGAPKLVTMALTATLDITGGPDVWVYVALLSVGTTPPTFRRGSTSGDVLNAGLVASDGYRFGTVLSGQTSLPSTVTIANIAQSSNSFWIGLN